MTQPRPELDFGVNVSVSSDNRDFEKNWVAIDCASNFSWETL